MIKILDMQVNYGKSVFGPNSYLEKYLYNAINIGIKEAVIIPTLTHELQISQNIKEQSCIWVKRDDKVIFLRKYLNKRGEIINIEFNPRNPYKRMNNHTLELIKKIDKKYKYFKLYFCAKIHPLLDEPSYVKELLENPYVIGLKLNGLATHTDPSLVPQWLINLIKKYNKPLFVHTDYLKNGKIWRKNKKLSNLIRKNSAYSWVLWAKYNNIKTYLAHGIRLDPRAAEIVNNSENMIVGLGPDLLLEREDERLYIDLYGKKYLDVLFQLLNEDKVVFSTDYAWNVKKRDLWENLDWETISRIRKYAKENNKTKEFLEKVFYKNAHNFLEQI